MPTPCTAPPKGAVGNRFITTLTKEFMLARTRVTNSERAEIFPACILRKERGCSGAAAIKRRILRRLVMWDEGKYAELAEDVARAARNSMGKAPMPDNDDSIARRYHSLVIDGRLKAAVRYATNRSGGGVLAPGDIDSKSGLPVIEVLRNKHPKIRRPELDRAGWASFEDYPVPRQGVPVDCDQGIVQVVAGGLGGCAGPNSLQ